MTKSLQLSLLAAVVLTTVAALASGVSEDHVAAPNAGVTTVELPYSQDFSSPAALSTLTILNENNDQFTWVLKNNAAWLPYNDNEASDDWLILPPMQLKAGLAYKVKFNAWAHQGNWFPERIEAKWGNAPTVEGMTTELLPPTDLTNKENEQELFECSIIPEADGIYYIGFHGISDKDRDGIFLDNILVTEQVAAIPAAPTDLVVTADPDGENKAEISFTAPTVTITGTAIDQLSKIEILRGDKLIHTFDNPAPGAKLSYADTDATHGLTTYHVIAYTDAGAGMEAFATLFVGINTPAPCPSVSVVESMSKPGQVTLTWEAPTVDVEGKPINQDKITYEVVERNGYWSQTVIKSNIRGTSYTYQAVPVGEQQAFKQWGVYAYTDNGTLHDTRTEAMPVGVAYKAPYAESFADGEAATAVSTFVDSEDGAWEMWTDDNNIGAKSQDGDNGFSGLVTQNQDDIAMLSIGKVSLAGVENPGLTFYLYNPVGGAGANLDELKVEVFCDGKWNEVFTTVLEDLAKTDAWNRVMISLEEFAEKTIYTRFVAGITNGGIILIDNVSIGTLYGKNIGATAVNAPVQVKPDKDFTVSVTVANLGTENADGYDVTLTRNGEFVATLPGKPVEVCDEVSIDFTDRLSVASDDILTYQATVNWKEDENEADNLSRRATVRLTRSMLPAPMMLEAEVNGSEVTLTWEEPDNRDVEGVTVTESFETAESWAIDNVDGWTFIDGDGGETYPIGSEYTYPNMRLPMAYQVFDADSKPFNTETGFDANSGSKYLVSMCSRAGANDDWAISPRLSGSAQKITLAASSFNLGGTGYQYLESFEVLYSKSGTSTDDFERLTKITDVPETWTEYDFDLPEGALYFAIRCISVNKYAFMLDDVTYQPDILEGGLSLLGYNVYRDGVKINENPVEDTSFIDTDAPQGDHTYIVTAVYDKGESNISNLATAMIQSGISGIGTDSSITVTAENGMIVVTGNVPAKVYTTDGRLVAVIPAAPRATLSVAHGLYIVKAATTTAKLLVR